MTRALPPLVLVALLAGCSDNAVLEVDLGLPASAEPGIYAYVQFDDGEASFTSQWVNPDDWPGTELTGSTQRVQYSAVSERFDIDLLIKVRFCQSPTCDRPGDEDTVSRGVVYRVQHPFYRGSRTEWATTIDEVPPGPPTEEILVDRCSVAGCITGAPPSGFCSEETGQHFCE